MKRTWLGMLFLVLTLAFAGAVACGGDDDGGDDDAESSSDDKKNDDNKDSKDSKDSKDDKKDDNGSSSSDGLATLKKVASNFDKATYKVEYEIVGSDPEDGEFDATLTLVTKPPKSKFGISGKLGDDMKEGAFLIIDDGTFSYLCLSGDGEEMCLKSESTAGEDNSLDLGAFSIDDLVESLSNDSSTNVKEVKGQKIAGKEARCFEVKSEAEGDGTICVSEKDGLLLLAEGDFDGARMRLKAKEVSTSPSDKDFEPPYPVTDLGSMDTGSLGDLFGDGD